MEKGVPIRAISRGLAALQAINRNRSLSMMEVAQAAEVPYPTACRIVQTLVYEGLIEREPHRKRYRPTALVHTLSSGHQNDDALVHAARPHLVALTRKVSWPVSLTTRVGAMMMVRDSTHALTSLTFSNYYPGYTLPIFSSSTGKAYLAFCDEEERDSIVKGIQEVGDPEERALAHLTCSGNLLETIRAKGYATQGRNLHTNNPGKTSSIAMPIMDGERVAASFALIFFASAMGMEKAVESYVNDMRETAEAIGAAIAGAANLDGAA